jgi:sugar lactone lactonase YvrE
VPRQAAGEGSAGTDVLLLCFGSGNSLYFLLMNRVSFCAAVVLSLLIGGALPTYSQSLVFNTLAGYSGQGNADGLAENARFVNPSGVAADGAGNVYVADTANHTIRMITSGGAVSTLAGAAGLSGSADGVGSAARFNLPQGVAVDSSNNVYVADTGNFTIRKITPSGVVSTLAGVAGTNGSTDGTGNAARFYEPEGIAVDGAGNVYVADTWNHTIRQITAGGVVSTLAGAAGSSGSSDGTGSSARFYQPQAVAVDGTGNVFVADTGNHTIRKIAPGPSVSTIAGVPGSYGTNDGGGGGARFYSPAGVAVDGAGNVYVADYYNQTIRKIAGGVVTTLAGLAGSYGTADGTGSAARFWGPAGVAVTGMSVVKLYVADSVNGTVRQVSSGGAVVTMAGSGSTGNADSPGSAARFWWPEAAAVDSAGNIFVADTQNSTVRKVTAAAEVSTFAGSAGSVGSADGTGGSARFYAPQGLAVNSSGTVFVADTDNATIRQVTAAGVVTTLAGKPGYPSVADGTAGAAGFYHPQGLAVDRVSNVYVADTWNHTIRKITPAGAVTTLAGVPGCYGCSDGTGSNVGTNQARFYGPAGVAVDSTGNVYVADCYNHTIRRVTPAGVVSTLAGLAGVWGSADGMNNAARFYLPSAIAVDAAGKLYVLDSGNQTLRTVTAMGTNWVVSTLAGVTGLTGSGDGPASVATFAFPGGLAMDGAGNVYMADTANNTVRLGALQAGGAPVIVSQPQSQVVNLNTDATFSVGVLGNAPFSYQWRFNGVPIAGATASNYTRSNAQTSDGGDYSVVVANSVSNVISGSASLTVNGPPFIVVQPQPQMVNRGQSATFSVVASGKAPLTYQWLLNRSSLPGGNGPSYTVPAAEPADQGDYSVMVSNPFGTVFSTSVALAVSGLQAWGDDTWGQTELPAQAYYLIAVSAGARHNLALRSDGVVVAWGDDSDGQCEVPATLPGALAIAAGGYHSLALQADGTVAAWGANDYGQTNAPAGLASVMGISAGALHNLALRRNGTVVAWGDNIWGQTNVPVGLSDVVAVAAGGNHSLVLKTNGTVVAWGENTDAQGNFSGQSAVPPGLGTVVAIAAGDYHSLAVRSDGTVAAWGDNSQGQCSVPVGLGNVVAVAGGGAHSLALKSDGTVVAWGANWNGQCSLPSGLADIVGIAAGENHSLALQSGNLPLPLLLSSTRQPGRFSTLVQTLNRKNYALEFTANLAGTNWSAVTTNAGNGAMRQLMDPAATTAPRFYRMRQWQP